MPHVGSYRVSDRLEPSSEIPSKFSLKPSRATHALAALLREMLPRQGNRQATRLSLNLFFIRWKTISWLRTNTLAEDCLKTFTAATLTTSKHRELIEPAHSAESWWPLLPVAAGRLDCTDLPVLPPTATRPTCRVDLPRRPCSMPDCAAQARSAATMLELIPGPLYACWRLPWYLAGLSQDTSSSFPSLQLDLRQ